MSPLRILVVEDEFIIGYALKDRLELYGHRVLDVVASADDAVEAVRTGAPDLVLLDILLDGPRTGIDAALDIRSFSDVPIAYLSGNIHLVNEAETRSTRPLGIYSKPPSDEELVDLCEAAQAARSGSLSAGP